MVKSIALVCLTIFLIPVGVYLAMAGYLAIKIIIGLRNHTWGM